MAWGKCTPQTAIAVQDSDRCSPTQPEHGNRGNSLAISAIAGWQPNGASWLDMARLNTANPRRLTQTVAVQEPRAAAIHPQLTPQKPLTPHPTPSPLTHPRRL